MSRNQLFSLLVAGLCLSLGASAAQALSFDEIPTAPELAAKAAQAFRGTVAEVRYATTVTPTSGVVVPYTAYTFVVDRNYHNTRAGDRVTLFQFGGWVDTDLWRGAPGLPTFEVGEHVAIFHNDDRQFLLASLYAGAGVRRFVWNGDQQITLSANWTALAHHPESSGLEIEELHECQPAATDPTQCATWIDADDENQRGPFPSTATARALAMEDFDRQVDSWLRANPIPSTVAPSTLDEAGFADKLANFVEAISVPVPGDFEPDIETGTTR